MTVRKNRARAKPMPAQKRRVADGQLPHPLDQKKAVADFMRLRELVADLEKAWVEETIAKERKDALAKTAKELAEGLRVYVESHSLAPKWNEEVLAFTGGTYALLESSRESAYLTDDANVFVSEARKRGMYELFVRVKEEPNLAAFLLGENRLQASKFSTARIEKERVVEVRPKDTKTKLRYVLNERKPRWEVVFPKK